MRRPSGKEAAAAAFCIGSTRPIPREAWRGNRALCPVCGLWISMNRDGRASRHRLLGECYGPELTPRMVRIRAARVTGMSLRDIAAGEGISTTRVDQLLAKAERIDRAAAALAGRQS